MGLGPLSSSERDDEVRDLVAAANTLAGQLAERDLRFINLDTATSLAALATKDIDAVFGSASLGFKLLIFG